MKPVGVLVVEAALSFLRALLSAALSPLSLSACSILFHPLSPAGTVTRGILPGVFVCLAGLRVALATVFKAEGWSPILPVA